MHAFSRLFVVTASHSTQQVASVTWLYCGRETYDPKVALNDSVLMGRSTCQRCRREFLIEDSLPNREYCVVVPW